MENTQKTVCSCSKNKKKITKEMNAINIATAVIVFFFPKCPICWITYTSFFGFIGLEQFEYHWYWKFIIIGIFLLISGFSLWKHYQNKSWISILLLSTGLLLLLLFYTLNYSQIGLLVLVGILLFASNFNFSKKQYFRRI
jgi:mercuric ion transport protein